ncbi:flagellar hook-basal body protein [Brevibacillus dissolubilis]|uniref:flagellar hook-basal body protein n=1 Tax=Brevibacillus dissolubilis TaxID=1844116 RepID=UPI001115CBBC|nr:flagellar hook-basal body protein [Brevibacillus dissolubilis]
MIRGLYTAASGMYALQNRQEVLANNLANVNTPGYKETEGVIRSFPEQLIARIRDNQVPSIPGVPTMPGQPVNIGRLHTGAYLSESIASFAQGDIVKTDNQFDIALTDNLPYPQDPARVNDKPVQPKLFFSVARLDDPANPAPQDAIRYTRNGKWNLNDEGYLVTMDGYYLLDQNNQPIQVQDVPTSASRDITVSSEGVITLPDQQTRVTLGIKVANNPYEMVNDGGNVYRYGGQGELANVMDDPNNAGFFAVRQGWMERSNVDPTRTMTDMMTVLRSYEANQRVISTIDGTMEKAVNEIGKL